MRSGDMDHLIVIQDRSATRDNVGGAVVTWVDRDPVWAAVEPITGKENFSSQQVQAETEILFRIRYDSTVTQAQRIVWDGGNYEILSVVDVKGKRTEMRLMAKTQKND